MVAVAPFCDPYAAVIGWKAALPLRGRAEASTVHRVTARCHHPTNLFSGLLTVLLLVGCGEYGPAGPPHSVGSSSQSEPGRITSDKNATSVEASAKSKRETTFGNNNMVVPITTFEKFAVEDFRTLPNCLKVFQDCLGVSFTDSTTARYKLDVSKVARRLCRVVLEVVDISADYDTADFKLLKDDGTSGFDILRRGGNRGRYERYLKDEFPINGVKSKGLKWSKLSVGDRVVLVGLGYIVPAGRWGATSYKGVPRGDKRYVMLRAFGKPNRFREYDYNFAFLVRNWYIASQ